MPSNSEDVDGGNPLLGMADGFQKIQETYEIQARRLWQQQQAVCEAEAELRVYRDAYTNALEQERIVLAEVNPIQAILRHAPVHYRRWNT